ncbi:DEMETER-like protein 3 [Rutidosis leptorrhynchoides]|uniref:DEMETER-like protein 3 n=1 Tax=Rutidosis leptorrhynchoides TaxID=125765 RepID=UPI003A991B19
MNKKKQGKNIKGKQATINPNDLSATIGRKMVAVSDILTTTTPPINVETKKIKKKAKFRPKVMSNSPMTVTPSSPGSSSGSGSSSCKRILDFGDCEVVKMKIFTKGGFSFTREVCRYIKPKDRQLKQNYKKKEDEWWKNEQELFQHRVSSFISATRVVQGNRPFMGWKGSVVDSVVGAFLAQNVADNMSSSVFMSLAAKYPKVNKIKDNQTEDAIDWNAVRCADLNDFSRVIQLRGQNNRIATRILRLLYGGVRIGHKKHGMFAVIDTTTTCVPGKPGKQVDTHVSRIVVRLGWVPVEKLPDGVQIHQLTEYPMMDRVQEYLSLRFSNLDKETLYRELEEKPVRITNGAPCTPISYEPVLPIASPELVDIEDLFLDHEVNKLKNAGRSRTEHLVYELPDSHHLLQALDKRDTDDRNPYLLAIWPLAKSNDLQDEETVFGTLLVPCRTATRGSFPLDGAFFQINEVFSDDESSEKLLVVPRKLLLGLTTRTLSCGTSITAIFEGMSTMDIQDCFCEGYVCIRGFNMKTREPRPLHQRFHGSLTKTAKVNKVVKSPRTRRTNK